MADPEKGTKKVSHEAIKEIQKLGMSKAISKYTSGEGSAEFRTAVERYYSPQRLKKASSEKKPMQTDTPKSEPKPVKMPESAPAAAQRRVAPKTTAEQALGKRNVETAKKAAKPVSNISSAIASQRAMNTDTLGKTVSSLGKKLGFNNPFKPRKRK